MKETYYKIINNVGLFQKTYGITDITAIPEGRRFVAHESRYSSNFVLPVEAPLLYFTDCAFDMMLWYPIFAETPYYEALSGNIRESCIYEIIPLSPVFKGRSQNDHELYRCGAQEIEFKKQVSIEQIAKLAIQEYEGHKTRKHWMYGRAYIKQNVANWQKRYSL